MTRYRISPAGVESVLSQTQGDLEHFAEILSPLQSSIEAVAVGTGNSGAILPALQEFFGDQTRHLDAIMTRGEAGLRGAFEATSAYIAGDYDMVSHAQAAAASVVAPVDLRPMNGPRPQ